MHVNGQLTKAVIERVIADPAPLVTTIGRMVYRTDTQTFKVQNTATTWQEFVDLSSAQTLQNKILSNPVLTGPVQYQILADTPTTNLVVGEPLIESLRFTLPMAFKQILL